MPKIVITSKGGLTNQVNQTITGTGGVGDKVKIIDGSTVIGTTIVDSNGNWTANTTLSNIQGNHSITVAESTTSYGTGTPVFNTLVNFNGINGSGPYAGLCADASGNLYGTTQQGGTSNLGTVFEIAAGTQTLTTLINFNVFSGSNPSAGLIADAAGNLYGTTVTGGLFGHGTVFEISNGTNVLTKLVDFNGTNGINPYGLISDPAGNLYGTTFWGGSSYSLYLKSLGYGTVFEIAAGTHALTTLVNFTGVNGWGPAQLIADASGNLYGTTFYGGSSYNNPYQGYGTVFKIAAGTNTLTNLINFTAATGQPTGNLVVDAAGNLYGTTVTGGLFGHGTVFEISNGTNVLTKLVDFNGTNGINPYGLISDPAGNLYGTTGGGGLVFQ
jgi:uncharacterized repeat protein (TIGR03803 family)